MDKAAIFNIQNSTDFEQKCLEVFRLQYIYNKVYQRYCNLLGVSKASVKTIADIPFLPIEFFKKYPVVTTFSSWEGGKTEPKIFTSSGTTGQTPSKHIVTDLSLYEKSFTKAFQNFYGKSADYCILALLPAYLEREGSSLVYMTNHFTKTSPYSESGFYLNNLEELATTIRSLEAKGQKTLLIGVSFALLDLIEKTQFQLKHTIIMETGGMKGRRKEMIRAALHQKLALGFGVQHIHSEYGMTELLSQAYSKGNGLFTCPPWMKIYLRNTENPTEALSQQGKTGGINVIDLANINSCSFIATQDLGRLHPNDYFEILGRFDHSDIRGCNLMAL